MLNMRTLWGSARKDAGENPLGLGKYAGFRLLIQAQIHCRDCRNDEHGGAAARQKAKVKRQKLKTTPLKNGGDWPAFPWVQGVPWGHEILIRNS